MPKKLRMFNYSQIKIFILMIIIMGVPSCVMIPYVPSSEVSVSDEVHTLPEEMIVTMGPPGLIDKLSNTIANTDGRIRIYDSAKLRDEIFPDGDARVSRLISDGSSKRFTERLQANYLVLVGATEKSDTDSAGEIYPLVGYMSYAGFWGAAYNKEEVRLSAIIIDLQNEQSMYEVSSSAEGTTSGIGLFYLVAIFPLTESSTIKGLGRKIAKEITQNLISDVVDIAVMAIEPLKFTYSLSDWGSEYSKDKKETALKILQEKAGQEDADAQLFLYQVQPTKENIIWLCRAADKGLVQARSEVGRIYLAKPEYGGQYSGTSAQPDLSKACMWFHLAELAQITDQPETNNIELESASYESAEVERTANVMTAFQLAEAEQLLLNWKPGQCEQHLSQNMVTDYANDPVLARLCTAADLGDFTSRDELGRIYFFGSRGVTEDLPHAYMWYRLAAKVYERPSGPIMQALCDEMTPEQRSIAKKLLKDWEVGQCEKEFLH
jgi:hypothetical protein